MNVLLVGSKADVDSRSVRAEEGEAVACEEGWDYFETSAKSGANVHDAFYLLACNVMNRLLESDPKNLINEPALALQGQPTKGAKKGNCC